MTVRLYLDDSRPFPAGYEGCRSIETAQQLLLINRCELISLDYNLGFKRPTGLDLLRWMKENNVFVPRINIHSTHPLGRILMWRYAKENFPDSEVTATPSPFA